MNEGFQGFTSCRPIKKGKEILRVCNADMDAMEADLLAGFSAAEVEVFRSFIGKILRKRNE
jgi:DNA-binding MarR family transcriptional regulator